VHFSETLRIARETIWLKGEASIHPRADAREFPEFSLVCLLHAPRALTIDRQAELVDASASTRNLAVMN
jgi:hypothetical protein